MAGGLLHLVVDFPPKRRPEHREHRNDGRVGEFRHMTSQTNRHSTLTWRKSSASGANNDCVEVAQSDSSVLIRDSHNRSGAVLAFTCAQWLELVRSIKTGKARHL